MIFLSIALILFFTFFSAFCSFSEIAFFSLPASRVKAWRRGDSVARRSVAKLLQDPQGLLVSIFFLNTVVNILIQNITSSVVGAEEGYWLLKVGVPFLLVFIFGELLPKYLGLMINEVSAPKIAPFYNFFQIAFKPVRYVIAKVTYFFSRVLFFSFEIEKPLSEQEIIHIIETSKSQGLLHSEESQLLAGYLALENKQARDIMTPVQQAPFYDVTLPISHLFSLFKEKRLFAVAVCQESFDKFLGILDAKTIIKYPENALLKYLKKPLFLPEATPGKQLLFEFEEHAEEIAVIVDEYGGISGIVERKNLLDALYVPTSEKVQHEYRIVNSSTLIASGIATLDELSHFFAYSLKSNYHQVTLNGYLSEKIGAIPKSGDIFREGPLFFRILNSDIKGCTKILIQKASTP